MNKFVLGFIAGAATYHYVSGGFNNKELVSEMRSTLKKVDERLAEKEQEETPTYHRFGSTTAETSDPTEPTP